MRRSVPPLVVVLLVFSTSVAVPQTRLTVNQLIIASDLPVVTLETRRPATERVSQSTAPSESAIETYTGLLVVESLPAGATVYLDNKSVGKTPLTLRSVHAGEHVIRLERDGYVERQLVVR